MEKKKGILITSFGSANLNAHSLLNDFVKQVELNFSDAVVKNAFTSVFISKNLNNKGITVKSVQECLEDFAQAGILDVVIQPTNLATGKEYEEKIVKVAEKMRQIFNSLKIGKPLMYVGTASENEVNYTLLALALQKQFKNFDDCEFVFMGHGVKNRCLQEYKLLQSTFNKMKLPVFIGLMEECFSLEHIVERLAVKSKGRRIILMPLLFIAGGHVEQELLTDDKSSWKNRLKQAGYEVEVYPHGICENKEVQEIYIGKIKKLL